MARKPARNWHSPHAKGHDPHDEQGGEWLRDLILGGQDGLVNVLGLVLGVATATQDARLIIISGLAAMFAEGISMGAVAYTSSKAALEFYDREKRREMDEIERLPEEEREEVRRIYYAKGFRGKELEMVVQKLTSNRERWLGVMMEEELKLFKDGESPLRSGIVVGIAALVGAVFPLIPFFLFPVQVAVEFTVPFSLVVLFVAGAIKGRFTKVVWWRSGIELALIGIGAALAGYLIGSWLGAAPGI
ncbi:MAG: VIT1/CCC1 transporter family protein [Candidatus Iainarchaeum archaeon]|uniref:VIT1/CCC1 transporter family protein n=1 Tax=Candidatus Iainarchaeum sp. TaxID=3101447 RepID=A0A7T9DJB6_9ARCH|nr:MAG: VIT1/CCC1 transporter family protein [Candidatus Diapherotrites archaeon]